METILKKPFGTQMKNKDQQGKENMNKISILSNNKDLTNTIVSRPAKQDVEQTLNAIDHDVFKILNS